MGQVERERVGEGERSGDRWKGRDERTGDRWREKER